MSDIFTKVARLKRPKLLARAARFGLADYIREKHLCHALRATDMPRAGDALPRLLDIEHEIELCRRTKSATYEAGRHIMVLTAIMSEAHWVQTQVTPVSPFPEGGEIPTDV